MNPSRPIVLTLNGQNQAELAVSLVKKESDLPFLSQRLICHIDCNYLSAEAKRALFVSNREDARKGLISEQIESELVKALRSDDELTRLNAEARDQILKDEDQSASESVKKEVSRLLKLQGISIGEIEGESRGGDRPGDRPTGPRKPRPKPAPIESREPPTFIRFVWSDDHITFYPGQRRYVRIETDASSLYHNPNDPQMSRINVITAGLPLTYCGSTPLKDGRMRLVFEASTQLEIGATGSMRVELSRVGLPVLTDEKALRAVPKPPAKSKESKSTLPPFRFEQVTGPDSAGWLSLGWPDDVNSVASYARIEEGTLVIYWASSFPPLQKQRAAFEQRSPQTAASFDERYKIWLAVHSLLMHQDHLARDKSEIDTDLDAEVLERLDREERVRTATMAALIAGRELRADAIAAEAIEA